MFTIADPSLGVDSATQAILRVINTKPADFAEFLENAQTFDVHFRTRAFYQDGFLGASIWMWPKLVPSGEHKRVSFGEHPVTNKIVLFEYMTSEDFVLEAPRSMSRSEFEDPVKAAEAIYEIFAESYGLMQPQEDSEGLFDAVGEV